MNVNEQQEGQQEGSQQQQQQEGQQTPPPQAVPIERFNQVYGELQDTKRGMASLQETLAQVQAIQAQLQAPKPPEEVGPEIDPDDLKKIDFIVRRATAPLHARIEKLQGQVMDTRVEPQLDRAEESLAKLNNPTVTARARQLMQGLRQQGKLGSVYTPEECVKVALGEFAMGQLQQNIQNQNERQQYNSGAGQGAPVGAGRQGSNQDTSRMPGTRKMLESKKLEDLSLSELEQISTEYDKMYPEGVPF